MAGMRPTWVLTDKEKKDRTKNKAPDLETANTLQRRLKDVGYCINGKRMNQWEKSSKLRKRGIQRRRLYDIRG